MADDLPGDQLTLEAHLRRTSFQIGVEEGRWEVCAYRFPYLEVEARARMADGTNCAMRFRLECSGFPVTGPFAQLWDSKAEKHLVALDSPDTAPSLVDAFKQWNEHGHGYGGIYRPWQRGAAQHNAWAQMRPDLAWHPGRELTFIMEQLHGLVSEQADWLDYRAAA